MYTLLECKDGTYYTGVTKNLQRRMIEHQQGVNPNCYTFSRRPIALAYHEEFKSIKLAIEKEKQIKKWSAEKKKALINNKFEQLKVLSKKNFKK